VTARPRSEAPKSSPRPSSAVWPTHRAQERAAALIGEAERPPVRLDHEPRLAAERLVESAKVERRSTRRGAREQGRRSSSSPTTPRKAVLNDLAVSEALQIQIEQLRAAVTSRHVRHFGAGPSENVSPESTTPMKCSQRGGSRPCDFDRTCPTDRRRGPRRAHHCERSPADTARGDEVPPRREHAP